MKEALEVGRLRQCKVHARPDRRGHQQGEEPALSGRISTRQGPGFLQQTVAHVYPLYEKRLRDIERVDFDDLLLTARRWRCGTTPSCGPSSTLASAFVLIDEYQDTNRRNTRSPAGSRQDQPNLCVVGDPDQSIYKWRGSDIRNILDFERDFPDARVITLDKNYRSTKAILHAASALIGHNKQRKKKSLVTDNAAG